MMTKRCPTESRQEKNKKNKIDPLFLNYFCYYKPHVLPPTPGPSLENRKTTSSSLRKTKKLFSDGRTTCPILHPPLKITGRVWQRSKVFQLSVYAAAFNRSTNHLSPALDPLSVESAGTEATGRRLRLRFIYVFTITRNVYVKNSYKKKTKNAG